MKISELIAALQTELPVQGDVEVEVAVLVTYSASRQVWYSSPKFDMERDPKMPSLILSTSVDD